MDNEIIIEPASYNQGVNLIFTDKKSEYFKTKDDALKYIETYLDCDYVNLKITDKTIKTQ